jgi:hypothetical protein
VIALGYMVHLEGRLRMTTPGRIQIYAAGVSPDEAAAEVRDVLNSIGDNLPRKPPD